MSTNAISSVAESSLSALVGTVQGSRRQGDGEDRHASGIGNQGITLLASLLQALTQAASAQPLGPTATAAGTTASTGPGAATGSTAPAGTPASPAGTSSSGGSTATTGSSGTNLVQDLQTFLHDLFGALRHAGRSDDDGDHDRPPSPAATGGVSATTGSTTAGSTTAGSTTSTPTAAGSGVGAYRPHGILYALQSLIQELGNSAAGGNTGTHTSTALSRLNAAFDKLIADLSANAAPASGTTPTAPSVTTGGTSAPASASTGGSTPAGSTAAASPSTVALQTFLKNFLQDLQNNGTHSLSSLGTSVNTRA